ncbi:hypothetical protein EON65_59025 [archaeon]|nr:MAG: hypothetical protein EON65_59025 [archaeon]
MRRASFVVCLQDLGEVLLTDALSHSREAAELLRLIERERGQLIRGKEEEGGGYVSFKHVHKVIQTVLRLFAQGKA